MLRFRVLSSLEFCCVCFIMGVGLFDSCCLSFMLCHRRVLLLPGTLLNLFKTFYVFRVILSSSVLVLCYQGLGVVSNNV